MTIRFRAASAASVALVLGLGMAAGCGKYSYSNLKAIKAFKDGNVLYQQKDYKRAAERYEDALGSNPDLAQVFFFLANSYDEQYKPAKAGDAQNDAFIQKAIDNYQKAAQRDPDPKMKKLALEYLANAFGSDKLNDPAKAEPVYQQIIQMEPGEPANYVPLAKLYEESGRYDDAEALLVKARDAKPNDPTVYTNLAAFYNRQGDFPKTIESLQKAADLNPNNPEGYHLIATYYWDKARKDFRLSTNDQKDFIMKGLAMEDKALGLNPEYMEAMTYKNILLRMEANTEKDKKKQDDLLKQADELRNKALELQKKKASSGAK
jgi:tetratricopeptide (TPR) repeat protein